MYQTACEHFPIVVLFKKIISTYIWAFGELGTDSCVRKCKVIRDSCIRPYPYNLKSSGHVSTTTRIYKQISDFMIYLVAYLENRTRNRLNPRESTPNNQILRILRAVALTTGQYLECTVSFP